MDSKIDLLNENIPIDILNDILMRLPTKSIGGCMLVSKRWYATVKNAPFIKIHLNHSKTKDPRVLIVQEGSYTIFAESEAKMVAEERGKIPFPVLERDLHILGSCKGLVLVRLRVEPRGSLVLLWNPLLEKFKVIDKILDDDRVSVFALGFHEASNDYRIVRVGRKPENNLSKVVDIYSFNEDSWQGIGETLADGNVLPTVAFPKHMATYVDGVVHWIANYDPQVGLNHYIILSFDFDKEVFNMIELPGRYTDLENPELKELNGKLVLSCYLVGDYGSSMLTWVMMNYPLVGSWKNIGCLFEYKGKRELWPVVCTKQENCVFRRTGTLGQYKLGYYNAKNDKIYHFGGMMPYTCPVINDFVECLVLLDAENDVLDGHIP